MTAHPAGTCGTALRGDEPPPGSAPARVTPVEGGLPLDLRIESATVRDEWLDVVFTPGGHRATYDVAGLLGPVTRVR